MRLSHSRFIEFQGNCVIVRRKIRCRIQGLMDRNTVKLGITVLTLRLLMSYIYGAPSKARNANVVYIWTYVWRR